MFGKNFFGLGWKGQFVTETLREALGGFGSEAFEVIADESPDVAHIAEMALDFERPAFERGFTFPEKLFVAMHVFAVAVVFGRVVAEQAEIKKIGGMRQKFKRRLVPLVERARVGPDPADAMFLQKADHLWPVPARMTKFNGKPKISRQLIEKFAQWLPAFLGGERRRQLNENNLQFCTERFDGAQERVQLHRAIAQAADVSDIARDLAGESKRGRRHLHPAPPRIFRWRAVKRAVDFDGGEVARIKLEPMRVREFRRIECPAPIIEGPGACADADFLLVGQIQRETEVNRN